MMISKSVLVGILVCLSIILSIVENFIPMPLPAIRLGLSNIPVLIAIYLLPIRLSFSVLFLKIFLVPIFSGNMLFRLSISVPSGIVSFVFVLIILRLMKDKISPISCGIVGAYFHMLTQIVILNEIYIKGILYTNLTGLLMFSAVITGVFTGIITYKTITHSQIRKIFET